MISREFSLFLCSKKLYWHSLNNKKKKKTFMFPGNSFLRRSANNTFLLKQGSLGLFLFDNVEEVAFEQH